MTCAPSSPFSSGSPTSTPARTGPCRGAAVEAGGRVDAPPARGGTRRQGALRGDRRADRRPARARGGLLGCETAELALTGSTTDGVNAVLAALDLGRGDEVLTSDEEHPGVLAPLGGAARAPRGERANGPFAELGGRGATRRRGSWPARTCRGSPAPWLTPPPWPPAPRSCCSTAHRVSAPCRRRRRARLRLLRRIGPEVAVRAQRPRLPVRTRRACRRAALALARATACWRTPRRRSSSTLHADARRFSTGFPAPHQIDWALAALDVLEEAGVEARACARGRRWRTGSRRRLETGWRRAGAPRWSPGRIPTPRGRSPAALGGLGRAQSARARASCARRWGHGPPRTSWSGWSRLATR